MSLDVAQLTSRNAWANLATAPIGVALDDCPPVLLYTSVEAFLQKYTIEFKNVHCVPQQLPHILCQAWKTSEKQWKN